VFNRVRRSIANIIMPPLNMMAAFFQKATAQGSRSTVLKPLAWLIALCLSAILGALKWNSPLWLLTIFAICATLSIALYLGTYVYCLRKNPDLLRSETYLIQKQVIEKGFVGDNVTGVFDVEPGTGIMPFGEPNTEQKKK